MRKNQSNKQGEPMIATTDFAATLSELEKVVADLENDVAIEKALALFERGMQLSNDCEKFLSAAEQKVEILKRSANGLTVETFTEISVRSINIDDSEVE